MFTIRAAPLLWRGTASVQLRGVHREPGFTVHLYYRR
jgi:hypothetical protein